MSNAAELQPRIGVETADYDVLQWGTVEGGGGELMCTRPRFTSISFAVSAAPCQ